MYRYNSFEMDEKIDVVVVVYVWSLGWVVSMYARMDGPAAGREIQHKNSRETKAREGQKLKKLL